MQILNVIYTTTSILFNEPIFIIDITSNDEDLIKVYKNKDLVESYLYKEQYVTEKVKIYLQYLRSIPFKQRIEMLENLIISKKSINKFNL